MAEGQGQKPKLKTCLSVKKRNYFFFFAGAFAGAAGAAAGAATSAFGAATAASGAFSSVEEQAWKAIAATSRAITVSFFM